MQKINDNGVQRKGQGKIVRSFYEEPRLTDVGLIHVPGVEVAMTRHGPE